MSSMGFSFAGLGGAWVAWLGGMGAVTLIALYLLRRMRRSIVVPFVTLWLPVASEHALYKVGRRLRRLPSLFLQLAVLTALLLAAGDPRPVARAPQRRTVVLLIDRSASMQALDETGARLGRARALAREFIAGLSPGDQALVASFAADVSASTGMEADHTRLTDAVDALAASDEPGNHGVALGFAATLLRGHPNPTVVLIGDGGGPDVTDPATVKELQNIDVRFLSVGRRRSNVGIVAFSARRSAVDGLIEAVVVTQNFRDTPAGITVLILAGPHRIPVERRALRLDPGERAVTALTGLVAPDARLEAVIEQAERNGGDGDDLPLDNRAFAVAPKAPPLSVLVVGRENLFLDGALLGMSTTVRFERVLAAAAEDSRPRWDRHDVVIFDGVAPHPQPTTGRFLYIDPHGDGSPWLERGVIAEPVVTDVLRDHALVKQLALADLNIAAARRLMLAAGDVAVASTVNAPLIVARTRSDLRQMAVAFDVRRSDLPLRSAFPLLLANSLAWLAQQPAANVLAAPTGRTVRIDLGASIGPGAIPALVEIRAPDGRRTRAPVAAAAVTLPLDSVGVFTIADSEGRVLSEIAANLVSPAESDLAPHRTLKIGAREIGSAISAPTGQASPASPREPWLWVLLAALLLAIGEWVTFHRRLTV